MDALERAGYLAHARTPRFRARLARAEQLTATCLEAHPDAYVSYSGGKDSTVTLDLARRVRPDIPAVLGCAEWHLPETVRLLEALPHLHWVCQTKTYTDWFTAWRAGPVGLPAGAVWQEPGGSEYQMVEYARRRGWSAALIGQRMDENARRRFLIGRVGPLHFAQANMQWQAYPIYDWSDLDVWAYLVSRKVPYNAAYDRMRAIGVPFHQQRIGPFAVDRVLGMGSLSWLRVGWPEVFEQFAGEFPEARLFV